MRLGAKTIGNATLIAIDDEPILATDPWLDGSSSYFGSWSLSHVIPERERAEIDAARFLWFSHGHPDHLNPDSIEEFRSKKILLSDHVGSRMKDELRSRDFDVTVLADRRWMQLASRERARLLDRRLRPELDLAR